MPKIPTGLASLQPQSSNTPPIGGVFSARVRYALTDDTNSQIFDEFGEWGAIGCIFFDKVNNPNSNPEYTSNNFARPLFPNNSTIPLKNEIVYVVGMPNNNVQSDVNDISYYYFQSINIWGSTHHNAIPDPINGESMPESQQQDYIQTEAGSFRRVTDGGTEIDLGENFTEKLSIRNLQPFEGDLIYQGRWGQSFRFGSTINSTIPDPETYSNNEKKRGWYEYGDFFISALIAIDKCNKENGALELAKSHYGDFAQLYKNTKKNGY